MIIWQNEECETCDISETWKTWKCEKKDYVNNGDTWVSYWENKRENLSVKCWKVSKFQNGNGNMFYQSDVNRNIV